MSSRRKSAKRILAASPESANNESQTIDIRQSIDRLIQKDPATVAQVLQDWLRNAS